MKLQHLGRQRKRMGDGVGALSCTSSGVGGGKSGPQFSVRCVPKSKGQKAYYKLPHLDGLAITMFDLRLVAFSSN